MKILQNVYGIVESTHFVNQLHMIYTLLRKSPSIEKKGGEVGGGGDNTTNPRKLQHYGISTI